MMKNFKRLFTFLLLVVMTVSMAFSACGTPSADNGSSSTSDNEIASADNGSSSTSDNEITSADNGSSSTSDNEITSSSDTEESSREETLAETKEKGVEAIDTYMQEIRDMDLEYSLVFIEREAEQGKQAIEKAEDKAQATALKEETLNAMKALVLTDEEALAIKRLYLNGKEPTITTIKAYFGQYGGNDVVIMRYDLSRIDDAPIRIGEYKFYFSVGIVRVYTKDTKYHLKDAYESGLISDEDLAKIYEDNGYICEREDFFD